MNVNPRFILNPARVAQWIRRPPPKRKIGGSSPPVGNQAFCFTLLPLYLGFSKPFRELANKFLSGLDIILIIRLMIHES